MRILKTNSLELFDEPMNQSLNLTSIVDFADRNSSKLYQIIHRTLARNLATDFLWEYSSSLSSFSIANLLS